MKKQISSLLSMLLVFQMMARPVSRQEAMKAAQRFLYIRGIKSSVLKEGGHTPMTKTSEDSDGSAYYIFNVGNNDGFVVISGDDRTDAVLGYSTSGEFDEATIPDNMRAWLQGYADQINSTRSYTRVLDSVDLHDPIKPLLTTKWGQDEPYNNKCPENNDSLCATGCAATALAQVLNYYRYPKDLPAIKGYTTTTNKIIVDSRPEIKDFNWDALKATYSKEDDDENIATLMLYCGQSMKMDYRPQSSSADDYMAAVALCNVFNYASAENAWRSQYSAKGWDELIYRELSNKNPVLYCGDSSGGAHTFVCDGYDGYGYYHINWGWEGDKDSYFLLSALNSDGGGTGASTTNDGYNFGQNAIINVKTTGKPEIEIKTGIKSFRYVSEEKQLYIYHKNNLSNKYNFDLGIGYLTDESIVFFKHLNSCECAPNDAVEENIPISVFDELPNGTYKIVPISRETGTEAWFDCRKNDDIYAEIEVVDGVASFVVMHPIEYFDIEPDIPESLFANCNNKISVSITNNYTEDIQKNVTLYYKKMEDEKLTKENTILQLKAKAGESMKGYLNFCPPSIGDYQIVIKDYDDNNIIYYTKDVTVEEIPSGKYNATVSNPRFIGGDSACLIVDVTNNDSFDHPGRDATANIHLLRNIDLEHYSSCEIDSELDAIPAGETVTLSFDISNRFISDWTQFANYETYTISLYNPSNKKNTIYEIVIPETKFYTAEISAWGYASFAKSEDLDFSECNDLEAYTGKVDDSKEYVVMTKREQVPANTGLVLKGTPYKKYAVKAIDNAEEIPDNDLVAVTEDKTIDADSVLTLECIDRIVGFYNFAETLIKAGQSYLPKTKTGDVSYMRLQWDSDPTSISNISVENKIWTTAIFNLAGQKVNENYRGIVIKNGKKIIVK